MAINRTSSLLVAVAQAKIQSLSNAVVYLHLFTHDNMYLIGTCKGSGKFVHSVYAGGKQILPVVQPS